MAGRGDGDGEVYGDSERVVDGGRMRAGRWLDAAPLFGPAPEADAAEAEAEAEEGEGRGRRMGDDAEAEAVAVAVAEVVAGCVWECAA